MRACVREFARARLHLCANKKVLTRAGPVHACVRAWVSACVCVCQVEDVSKITVIDFDVEIDRERERE